MADVRGSFNMLTTIDGKGTGFGKKISIQTVGLVNAFKHLGQAYNIQEGNPGSTMRFQKRSSTDNR